MKPFLGIDLTYNKKNEQTNGADLLCCKPSAALAQALDAATGKAQSSVEKSMLPPVFRVIQWVCGIGGLAIASGIIKGLGEVTVKQAYQNAPYLFWVAGGCLAIWGTLKLLGTHKAKTVLGNEESISAFSNYEGICNAIYTELSVPADAQEMDIIVFRYKEKDNEIKPVMKGMENTPYYNLSFKVFSDAENLYVANLEGKYAIPLNAIQTIRTENKRIALLSWNKEEHFSEGRYKPYKLTANNYGNVFCKPYHILEFIHNDETWGIWFPAYELPILEESTK